MEKFYEEFGHTGISCYYLLMEICTEKLEKDPDQSLEGAALKFSFAQGFVRKNLRISAAKLQLFLGTGAALGLFSYEMTEKELHIEMPILLDLLDSDSKRSRSKRATAAPRPRLEEEKERDKDKEEEKKKSVPAVSKLESDAAKNGRKEIKQTYINAYRSRYGVDPSTDNAAFNAQVVALQKKLGTEESCQVVQFFLNHPKSYYVENTHAFWIIPKDAETLRTQMLRGKPITKTMVRDFEKKVQAQEYQEQVSNLFTEDDNVNNG